MRFASMLLVLVALSTVGAEAGSYVMEYLTPFTHSTSWNGIESRTQCFPGCISGIGWQAGTVTIVMRDEVLPSASFNYETAWFTEEEAGTCFRGTVENAITFEMPSPCDVVMFGPAVGVKGQIEIAWTE